MGSKWIGRNIDFACLVEDNGKDAIFGLLKIENGRNNKRYLSF